MGTAKRQTKCLVGIGMLLVSLILLSIAAFGCTPGQTVPSESETTPSEVVTTTEPAQPEPTESKEPEPTDTEPAEEKPVNRIVCLAPSMVEVVYALGAGDDIVGWSQYTDYPPEVTKVKGWQPYEVYEYVSDEDELQKQVAVVAGFTDVNLELVKKLEPTVIFSEADIQRPMTDLLRDEGFDAYNYIPSSIEEIYDMMIEVGSLIGREEEAAALVQEYKDEIAAIRAVTQNLPVVNVYLEISHQVDYNGSKYGPYVTGGGTPFDEMVEIAGGRNVFGHLEGDYVEITFEDTVEVNPDVILSPMWPNAYDYEITTIREIMTRPGFEDVSAVKTSRVHFYDSSLFKRFGPRTVTAIQKLAYLLHPYHFENPDDSVSPWELGKIDELYPPDEPLR